MAAKPHFYTRRLKVNNLRGTSNLNQTVLIMEDYSGLSGSLDRVTRSLQPFIKPRQNVRQIRRLLSSHLSSHLSADRGLPFSRPLSLIDPTNTLDATPHGVRGLQKEYLRCVRSNIKARTEYSKISKDHRASVEEPGPSPEVRDYSQNVFDPIESFLDLNRQRQKHERLRITQDYIDMLGQKPAANAEYLNPQEVLKDVEALPKVPSEIMHGHSSSQVPEGRDLKGLVDQLEKSVLRAKMLLKREQKLLAKVQADKATSTISQGSRLQAIEVTRHELINWIEGELAGAGESPLESEDGPKTTESTKKGKEYVGIELESIQRQYARYTKARQALVSASMGNLAPPSAAELDQETDLPSGTEESRGISDMNQAIYPYLEAIVLVSNEQKAMIQQKSHLTISLAKQLKEGSQGLDRLAHESHLLPTHPISASISQRKALAGTVSFGEQMSSHEKPDTSRGARAWKYASESATNATKDAILEKLEEGTGYLVESQETLAGLQNLLGTDDVGESQGKGNMGKRDIWATLDGNLGVIKGDITES